MILKPQKLISKSKPAYITTTACNDPTVKLVATALITHVITHPEMPIITYKELSKLCHYKVHYHLELDSPLGDISELCILNNLPPISAVVYRQNEGLPGPGFFKTFYPALAEKNWDKKFYECIEEVKSCNKWKSFITIFE